MLDTEGVPAKSPAALAALDLGISRERVVRLVQRGVLMGSIEGGRWLVDTRSIERYKAQEQGAA